MIISASRRTDIPAFYGKWLVNRLKAEFVMIPNPYVANKISRIELSPKIIDCIVFWTKNPAPIFDELAIIKDMGYQFYFQFTLNAYGQDLEKNVPPLQERTEAFRRLSEKEGKERVVWRYDPVIISDAYTAQWHTEHFELLCESLYGYTSRVVFSFVDLYKGMEKGIKPAKAEERRDIALAFAEIAKRFELEVFTCAEKEDFSMYGIKHSACIDKSLIQKLIGYEIDAKKDANQRTACGCIESIDIGMYNTCTNGCTYCYATQGYTSAKGLLQKHDTKAPMLAGYPPVKAKVENRKSASSRRLQTTFFDE